MTEPALWRPSDAVECEMCGEPHHISACKTLLCATCFRSCCFCATDETITAAEWHAMGEPEGKPERRRAS